MFWDINLKVKCIFIFTDIRSQCVTYNKCTEENDFENVEQEGSGRTKTLK